MTFLQFHAIAAERGDGLRPELKELLDRLAAGRTFRDAEQSIKPDSVLAFKDRPMNGNHAMCDKGERGARHGLDTDPFVDPRLPDRP